LIWLRIVKEIIDNDVLFSAHGIMFVTIWFLEPGVEKCSAKGGKIYEFYAIIGI